MRPAVTVAQNAVSPTEAPLAEIPGFPPRYMVAQFPFSVSITP